MAFLDQSSHLGVKLGCYLIQLPPSLKFDPGHTANFLREFREISNVPAVCEPRHVSWSSQHASDILSSFQVGIVQADPSPVPQLKDVSAGDVVYLRLHGSPRIYYSNYDGRQLEEISARIRSYHTKGHEVWCIFDNTALGAATINALQLQSSLNNTSDSAVS